MIDEKWGQPHPLHDPYILAHFKARPTDVLITTAPKAGTTWMQQILHQIRSGGDADFDFIDNVVPWLELPREGKTWQQRLSEYNQIPAPRIFKTHCTFDQTPGFGTLKIVMTSRDPRDCCVSMYHHMMSMTDRALKHFGIERPSSFDQFVESWLSFGAWYRNVKSWWPYKEHDRVLWLRYEDLVKDFASGLDQLIAFLEWPLEDEQRNKVLEYCAFAWMKQHSERFETYFGDGEPMFMPKQFIRKGAVGDHQTTLNESQQSAIVARAREELSQDCLEFLGIGYK